MLNIDIVTNIMENLAIAGLSFGVLSGLENNIEILDSENRILPRKKLIIPYLVKNSGYFIVKYSLTFYGYKILEKNVKGRVYGYDGEKIMEEKLTFDYFKNSDRLHVSTDTHDEIINLPMGYKDSDSDFVKELTIDKKYCPFFIHITL